ncbi:MAG: cyclic nucleotide-binding domain-containing protein [Elusimicrobia bacterium]|nr:cyclic nucleotide-binding domain-containing protein [Elusimicrobiota bacterium]
MSTDQNKIAAILARTPPFTGASEADIAALAGACSLHKFAPKAQVFTEGDRATAGWLIVSGRVRILIFAGFKPNRLGPANCSACIAASEAARPTPAPPWRKAL